MKSGLTSQESAALSAPFEIRGTNIGFATAYANDCRLGVRSFRCSLLGRAAYVRRELFHIPFDVRAFNVRAIYNRFRSFLRPRHEQVGLSRYALPRAGGAIVGDLPKEGNALAGFGWLNRSLQRIGTVGFNPVSHWNINIFYSSRLSRKEHVYVHRVAA